MTIKDDNNSNSRSDKNASKIESAWPFEAIGTKLVKKRRFQPTYEET
jgi:hypothetical protein